MIQINTLIIIIMKHTFFQLVINMMMMIVHANLILTYIIQYILGMIWQLINSNNNDCDPKEKIQKKFENFVFSISLNSTKLNVKNLSFEINSLAPFFFHFGYSDYGHTHTYTHPL